MMLMTNRYESQILISRSSFFNINSIALRKPRITLVTLKLKSFCGNLRSIILLCKEETLLFLLTLGLWPMLHLFHMLVVHTLIIQLPQSYETYGFNASSEQQIFREVFLWAKILLGDCRAFPRGDTSVNFSY